VFALRRSHTPQDQAGTETLFGYVKDEWLHPEKIRGSDELLAELARVDRLQHV
jgi:hypothetical protein